MSGNTLFISFITFVWEVCICVLICYFVKVECRTWFQVMKQCFADLLEPCTCVTENLWQLQVMWSFMLTNKTLASVNFGKYPAVGSARYHWTHKDSRVIQRIVILGIRSVHKMPKLVQRTYLTLRIFSELRITIGRFIYSSWVLCCQFVSVGCFCLAVRCSRMLSTACRLTTSNSRNLSTSTWWTMQRVSLIWPLWLSIHLLRCVRSSLPENVFLELAFCTFSVYSMGV